LTRASQKYITSHILEKLGYMRGSKSLQKDFLHMLNECLLDPRDIQRGSYMCWLVVS
jgi:hypothetical protein